MAPSKIQPQNTKNNPLHDRSSRLGERAPSSALLRSLEGAALEGGRHYVGGAKVPRRVATFEQHLGNPPPVTNAPSPLRSLRRRSAIIMMYPRYDAPMRTTIDLPEDLHRVALAIARDQGTSLSQTVVQIMERGLGTSGTARVSTSERTGLEVVRLGRVVTSEDVRALEDDS